MGTFSKALGSALLVIALVGCNSTPQPQVNLSADYYTNSTASIGVYMDELPEGDTHIFGASCLLCYGVASAANSSLTNHMNTLDIKDLKNIAEESLGKLKALGADATMISETVDIKKLKKFKTKELNFARKDFRGLKEKFGVDKLLVIDIHAYGAYRPYSAYVPMSDPTGYISGTVYLVDLNTNKYDMYGELSFNQVVEGEWDEPPTFPGVTAAYYQALELAKEKVIKLLN